MYTADFVARVILWNSQRYEQKSNSDLTLALLAEEVEELGMADNEVEALDAIGDVVFVAVGALWKLGFDEASIKGLLTGFSIADLTSGNLIKYSFAKSNNLMSQQPDFAYYEDGFKDATLVVTVVNIIFNTIIPALLVLGRVSQLDDIMKAICDSNATKTVPDTLVDPSVKANSGVSGKGKFYCSPTLALQGIAESPRDLEA